MVSLSMMLTGLGVLALGALGVRYGYQLSTPDEQSDSIGSTNPVDEVEPAGWRVALTRLCFGILGTTGAGMIVMSMFSF
ncbi:MULTISPECIES: hypothetical protein [unclassified Haladaptatus]|uniref:hypothetical protein n=1 Tax=unclassified Haladaptatus TaxID=2622732 RepID=UPI00209BE2A2|nr:MULTISPECIES: hypothetical protein [unclassified Haladaptatus]MCO8246577.1 hypothetical protein [Haladaptatus sp. AB643]MCO8256302.1 hypothetical protein [Haladaptatus sp. AB618]